MFLYDNEYFQIRYLSDDKLWPEEELFESLEKAIDTAKDYAIRFDYAELWLVAKNERIESLRQLNKYYRDDIIQSCLKEIYEY